MSKMVQTQCGECKNYKIEGKKKSNGVWYCSRCWVSFDESLSQVKEKSNKTIVSITSKKKVGYIVQLQDIANQLVRSVYGLHHLTQCLGNPQNVLITKNKNTIIEVKIPDKPYKQHNNFKSSKQCRNKQNHKGKSKKTYGGNGCNCYKCVGPSVRNINKEVGNEKSLIKHINRIVLHAKNSGVTITII